MDFDSIVCLGDVNIDLLRSYEPDYRYFKNMKDSLQMSQLISDASRRAADHETIFHTLSLDRCVGVHKVITIRDFKNIDRHHFENDLIADPWQRVFSFHQLMKRCLPSPFICLIYLIYAVP